MFEFTLYSEKVMINVMEANRKIATLLERNLFGYWPVAEQD
jgi:hypothetical protein